MTNTKLTLSNEAADLMADMACAALGNLKAEYERGIFNTAERKACRSKMLLLKEILSEIPTR